MLVITATSGSAQRVRRSISPSPRIAISTTSAWVSAGARRIVRGTPTSLFSLSTLAPRAPKGARAARISSRVVVFPADPVTPTTGIPSWRRQARASCW